MADTELITFIDALKALETRFAETPVLGLRLDADDQAEYQQLAMEARSVLSAELGQLNDFSTQLMFEGRNSSGIGPSVSDLKSTRAVIQAALNEIGRRKTRTPAATRSGATNYQRAVHPLGKSPYVAHSRIDELRAASKTKWDTARLVRLLEELNTAHANGLYMATAMLGRAITDHVPPIFGRTDFSEVANNITGNQSLKRSLIVLDTSLRNIADSHLHLHIRKKEALPTERQIAFGPDLDVLLGEVSRLLTGP